MDIVNLEIKMLKDFRCENIVQIMGSEIKSSAHNKKEAFILLEYCPGGHLLDILNRKAGVLLPISTICDVFGQVLKAVRGLHEHVPPVTHRDLKLENILKARNGAIKLCDFGSCVFGTVPLTTTLERSRAEEVIAKTTTQSYRSPELIDLYMREELTEKSDIWVSRCSGLDTYYYCLLLFGLFCCNVYVLESTIDINFSLYVDVPVCTYVSVCVSL
jgi:AP2-associated kinase